MSGVVPLRYQWGRVSIGVGAWACCARRGAEVMRDLSRWCPEDNAVKWCDVVVRTGMTSSGGGHEKPGKKVE